MKQISFFLADNQYLSRTGLKHFLNNQENLTVIGESDAEPSQWLDKLDGSPDILIIDYEKEQGQEEIVKAITSIIPKHKVLIISDDQNVQTINLLISSGLPGYLTKSCSRDDILDAIHALIQGRKFYCNKVLEMIVTSKTKPNPLDTLTAREIEVLELIAQGKTTKKMADELCLSVHTINSHRKNLLKKLNFTSPAQLIAFAINHFH